MPSAKKASSASKRKPKAALEDAVTEMDGRLTGRGFGKAGTSAESRQARLEKGLIVEPVFLPRTREEALLRDVQNDPAKYYLPRPVERDDKEWMLVAPPGLPEELENLFLVEKPLPLTKALGGGKRVAIADDDATRPGKRARTGDDDVELGRERQGSFVGGGMGLDDSFDMPIQDDFGGFNVDDFQPDYPASRSVASREASFPVGEALHDLTFDMPELGESILSIFDEDRAPGHATEQPATKWSKNTVRALKVLKKELGPDEAEGAETASEEKTMSFQDVANKVRPHPLWPRCPGADATSARPRGAPHRLSSSSSSSSARATASSSTSKRPTARSKSKAATGSGRSSATRASQARNRRPDPNVSARLHTRFR